MKKWMDSSHLKITSALIGACLALPWVAGASMNTPQSSQAELNLPAKGRFAAPVSFSLSVEAPSLIMRFRPKVDTASSSSNPTKETELRPNSHTLFGIGADYDGYGAILALPLAQSHESIESKGTTDHFDLILHRYWRSNGVEFFYEWYKGFYKTNGGESTTSDDRRFERHSDVTALHTGLNYYHLFSPESYRLDLRSWERTGTLVAPKSGGSFLGLLAIDYNQLSAERPFLRAEDGAGAIDSHDLVLGGDFVTATVGGGYGYTFHRSAHSVRGQLLMGIGPQRQKLTSLDRSETLRTMTATKISMTGDYGYFFGNATLGMNLKGDVLSSNMGSYEMTTTIYSFLIYALWRM